MKRAVLLVLDGVGAGAMEDVPLVRPKDSGAYTLRHVLERTRIGLPFLEKLGMGQIINDPTIMGLPRPLASYGRCNLFHPGADSYAGHNEIMGAKPLTPKKQYVRELSAELERRLSEKEFQIRYPIPGTRIMLIDDEIVIADNMENDPGQIINITGALDVTPFPKILAVGEIVREVAETSRVIALGGTDIVVQDILDKVVIEPERTGVDMGQLNIYNEDYQVRHLGYGITPAKQIQTILMTEGLEVYLYGKMADVITGNVSERNPIVDSQAVVEAIRYRLAHMSNGLIAATIQETDLAGHEQDAEKFAQVLKVADHGAQLIYDLLQPGEMLIVTADHGNDPTIGSSQHTREAVPCLVCVKGGSATNIGFRPTLADIAATIADYFNVKTPEFGNSILDKVRE